MTRLWMRRGIAALFFVAAAVLVQKAVQWWKFDGGGVVQDHGEAEK